MKKLTLSLIVLFASCSIGFSQTNTFPTTGNAGVGTTTPITLFQVNGGTSQFGGLTDFSQFNTEGDLSFTGNADYLVGSDKYAFRYSGNTNYGLLFSLTNSRYEFRDGSALPVFWITGSGNGYIKSKLAIGSTNTPTASLDITPTNGSAIKIQPFGTAAGNTADIRFAELVANGTNYVGFKAPDNITGNKTWVLPGADGSVGQYLKTDGAGNLSWSSDANTTYSAGSGIAVTGTIISNTAPDQTVTIEGDITTEVSGSYPNFTISTTESDPEIGALNEFYIPRWNGLYLEDGTIYDDGDHIGIGEDTPANKLDVYSDEAGANAIKGYYSGNVSGTSWDIGANYNGIAGYTESTDYSSYQAGVYGYVNGGGLNTGGVVGAWSENIWGALGYRDGIGNDWGIYSNGATKLQGNLVIDNGSQAEGYILTSDVDGNASWTDPSTFITDVWATSEENIYNTNVYNVGIGTNSPSYKTDIWTDYALVLRLESSTADATIMNINNTSSGSEYRLLTAGALYTRIPAGSFAISNGNSDPQIIIDGSNQRVGIYQTNPEAELDVLGRIKTNSFQMTDEAEEGYILQSNDDGIATWVDPETIEQDPTVQLEVNNFIPRWNGNALIDGIIFDNGERVGIGNNDPSQLLDVEGNIQADAYFIDNVLVLTTDYDENTLIGEFAAPNNTGTSNTVVGNYAANTNTTGSNNTYVGGYAGMFSTTATDNTYLGYNSGRDNSTGIANTMIGVSAGIYNTGNNNVFIGFHAGQNEAGSNKLYIANNAGDALIYGDFSSGELTIQHKLITENLKVTDGATDGYILQSDASGNAFWADPSTVAIGSDDLGDHTATQNILLNGYYLSNDGGNEGIYVSATGNVGVGTTSPNIKLHIPGNSDAGFSSGSGLFMSGDVSSTNLVFDNNEIMARNNGAESPIYLQNDGGEMHVHFNQGGGSQFSVLDNGHVGIGTGSPGFMLDIQSSISVVSNLQSSGASSYISSSAPSGFEAAMQLKTYSAGTLKSRWMIGKSVGSEAGSNAGSDFFINAYDDAGSFSSQPFVIKRSNGAVGIGNTSPSYQLDVRSSVSGSNYVTQIYNNKNTNTAKDNGLNVRAGHDTYNAANQSALITFSTPAGTTMGSVIQSGSTAVSYLTTSDMRLKENIRSTEFGLEDLMKIQVSDYNYKNDQQTQTGYLAQQLYTIFPDAVHVGSDDQQTDPWMVDYGRITPLIVKSVQEISANVDSNDSIIQTLQNSNLQLQSDIEELKSLVAQLMQSEQLMINSETITLSDQITGSSITLDGAWLEQNIPNPFDGTTIIRCYVPEGFQSAQLIISSQHGVVLKRSHLTQSGINEITIDANSVSAGIYQYTFVIDGKVIDTKQMVLAK